MFQSLLLQQKYNNSNNKHKHNSSSSNNNEVTHQTEQQRTLERSRRLAKEISDKKAASLVATVTPEFIRSGERTFNREVRNLSNLMQKGMSDYELGMYLEDLVYKANPHRAAEIMQKQRRARMLGASATSTMKQDITTIDNLVLN